MTIAITDPADARVDDYRELNNQAVRTAMEGAEFFMAEGYLAIDRLIDSGHRLRSVLLGTSRVERFVSYLEHPALTDVPVFVADRAVMQGIVGFNLHRGVLASAFRKPMPTVAELAATATRIAVLEALNDNENVGAISRAARAFGIDGIVISPTCTDPYYRRTVRVSMGEVLHMPIARASADDWPGALDTLHEAGFETWAMTPADNAVDLWATAIPERLAIVLGAEGPGLERSTLQRATRRVRIPISPDVDSLNVGHAAAITFAATSRSTTKIAE
ncbi:MAG: RNA methyltransferase [Actinomycetota bacterium]|jgi:tRNA G18 (ribose-2'-O)-methylase SpoU|uniref:TrmH family RNA methyltransferase n=1 Tax=uncultured Ilumatobacter sp. TaxID=879968 RepID=UPI00374F1C40|nr:RNA methyltransferase [Actinomycetota bacterium]